WLRASFRRARKPEITFGTLDELPGASLAEEAPRRRRAPGPRRRSRQGRTDTPARRVRRSLLGLRRGEFLVSLGIRLSAARRATMHSAGEQADAAFCCPSRTQMPSEGVEARVPVTGQGGEKLLRDLNGGRLEPVADAAPLARLGDDQPGLGEHAEVFGDRLPGNRQDGRQVRR